MITASIVLFNDEVASLSRAVTSFLNSPGKKKLFLIDNSPDDSLRKHFNFPEVEYIFNGANLGFGKAHNIVLDKIVGISEYHLVLNPDVYFEPEVIPELVNAMSDQEEITMMAPMVIFPDGKFQYNCRKYPTPFELISRRLNIFKSYSHKREYRNVDLSRPFFPDFIQGCFQLYRTRDFIEIGGFDERYFLYMEDVDICRKIDHIGKRKKYFPQVQITHVLKKGSAKSLKLFLIHLSSTFKYFKKWGIA